MSNVLIGIIGVILFIGLALAGALFLGPRFQEATVNSKASAQMAGLKQIADAVNMYRVQEGKDDLPQNSGTVQTALVSAKYLKAPFVDASGKGVEIWYSPTSGTSRHILLGQQDANLCTAVNRQYGVTTTPTGTDLTSISGTAGCIDLGGGNRVLFVAA